MTRRNGDINLVTAANNLAPGSAYTINVLKPGGVASAASSGATLTLYAGHGFAAGDKIIVGIDATTYSGTQSVSSRTSTTIIMTGGSFNVNTGDTILNLGADTGTSSPNYDVLGTTIYSDPGGINTIANSQLTSAATGEYGYWHKGPPLWELIRTSGGVLVASDLGVYPASLMSRSSTGTFDVIIGSSTPAGFTSESGLVGIFVNKTSSTATATGYGIYVDSNERWSMGQDYVAGNRSYFALWSDKGAITGGAWDANDIFGVSWGGAELDIAATVPRVAGQSGCDGPKWRFNSFFTPGSDVNTYSNAFQYEFYLPTIQTSGDGIKAALFQSVRNAAGATVDFNSGGIQVNVSGSRAALTLINETNAANTRKAYIAAGSGGVTGFAFGVDIPATNTQNWSIYDYTATAYRLYMGTTGAIGIGTGAAIGSEFFTLLNTTNGITRIKIDNQSAGNAARAGLTGTSDVGYFTLEAFSSTFAAETTLQQDTMLYTTGTGAMLHLGTAGIKRVTILDTSAKVGIGVDPPLEALQINGAMAILDGMTAPSTHSGYASIYVDTADGDLKVKFGDGVTKTIATNP
jgi:hypothetical protein